MSTQFDKILMLNLQLFADGAGDGAAAGSQGVTAPVAGEQAAVEGAPAAAQTATPTVDPEAEFDALVKGQYKDQYNKRVNSTVRSRLKQSQDEMKGYRALAERIADVYGLDDAKDLDKIMAEIDKIERPDLEKRAFENGLTEDQQREFDRLEARNRRLERERREAEAENRDRAMWMDRFAQADALKQKLPWFDFEAEWNGDDDKSRMFRSLLDNGFTMESAYKAAHSDEITQEAMQYAAQHVQQGVINNVRANGIRPAENGTSSGSAISERKSAKDLTDADIDDIIARVGRGERITFS